MGAQIFHISAYWEAPANGDVFVYIYIYIYMFIYVCRFLLCISGRSGLETKIGLIIVLLNVPGKKGLCHCD